MADTEDTGQVSREEFSSLAQDVSIMKSWMGQINESLTILAWMRPQMIKSNSMLQDLHFLQSQDTEERIQRSDQMEKMRAEIIKSNLIINQISSELQELQYNSEEMNHLAEQVKTNNTTLNQFCYRFQNMEQWIDQIHRIASKQTVPADVSENREQGCSQGRNNILNDDTLMEACSNGGELTDLVQLSHKLSRSVEQIKVLSQTGFEEVSVSREEQTTNSKTLLAEIQNAQNLMSNFKWDNILDHHKKIEQKLANAQTVVTDGEHKYNIEVLDKLAHQQEVITQHLVTRKSNEETSERNQYILNQLVSITSDIKATVSTTTTKTSEKQTCTSSDGFNVQCSNCTMSSGEQENQNNTLTADKCVSIITKLNDIKVICDEVTRWLQPQTTISGDDNQWESNSIKKFSSPETSNTYKEGSFFGSSIVKNESLTGFKYTTEDVDLLLIGKCGTGKSATGNSILRRRAFVSQRSTRAVTTHAAYEITEFNGRFIKVVDGPGIGDTSDNIAGAMKIVIRAIEYAIAANPRGYHAFLLVVRFGGRFTDEDQDTVEFLKQIFGEDFVQKFCILVMTYGKNFKEDYEETGKTFQEWCEEQEGFVKNLYLECDRRAVLFDNTTNSDKIKQKQIAELLKVVDHLASKGQTYTEENFLRAEKTRRRVAIEAKLLGHRGENRK